MPPLSLPSELMATAMESSIASNLSPPFTTRSTTNATQMVEIICAWPVSGQYGTGSRMLYYALVVACVLGRSLPWLRSACLAAALLVPAVAALHGIVLAALHVDGAIDMDIYGAFQICAIGVLAGPVTVKLSHTYFNAPGRNLIFLWTGVVLAGLVSLTVEFFRSNSVPCPSDQFQQGDEVACGLDCSIPFSPMRTEAQNNIYIIPAPETLSFGAATTVAAACCIPAILSLVSMWNKILRQNWTKRFGINNESEDPDQTISGTNAATPAKMLKVNDRIKFYLKMIEIPVFGVAILAIIVAGEKNFFTPNVSFQTEPIASVGQWAPLAGTALAALGSLYVVLAKDAEKETSSSDAGEHHCSCSHHRSSNDIISVKPPSHVEYEGQISPDEQDSGQDGIELSQQETYQSYRSAVVHSPSKQLTHTSTRDSKGGKKNSRHRVASTFERVGEILGTPAPDAFDDSEFQSGRAADFPEVPGESERNPELHKTKESYNYLRELEGTSTPLHKQRSRPGSFVSDISERGLGIEGISEVNFDSGAIVAGPSNPSNGRPNKERSSTLEVPKKVYRSPTQRRFTTGGSAPALAPAPPPLPPNSPTITVSESQT